MLVTVMLCSVFDLIYISMVIRLKPAAEVAV